MSIANTPETIPAGMLEHVGTASPLVHRLLLVIGCALLFCLWLGRVPLVEVDETRYATASRQMIETRDYIIPHYNRNVRYEKPILIYWVQGASMRLLGKSEFAARLPSGVAGLLLVLIIYGFLLRWLTPHVRNPRQAGGAAFLGAAALATLPLFAVWTRAAATDIILTLFITLTMIGLLQADLARRRAPGETAGRREAARWYLLAAFCCGLAFLTKGPIAVLVPVLTWLIYHLRQGTLRAEVRRVPWLPAILLFLAVAAPWYAATYFRDKGEFLRQFFLEENMARYSGGEQAIQVSFTDMLTERIKGIAGYLAVLLLFLFPYGAFLLDELRREHRGSAFQSDSILGSIRRFAWIWIAVSVGFIVLSKTQYPNYVQNIVAAVAIIFTLYLLELRRVGGWAIAIQFFYGSVWLAVVEMVLLPQKPEFVIRLLGKFRPRPWSPPLPEQAAHALMIAVAILGLALLAAVVVGAVQRRSSRPISWTMATWAAFLALLLIGVAPLAYTNAHGGSAEAGLAMRGYPQHLYTVAYCPGKNLPENMVYYGHREVTFIKRTDAENLGQLAAELEEHGELLLVTDAPGLEQAATLGRVTVLERLDYFIITRVERSTNDNLSGNL
ncbi:MAG: ArnT family glycosyltransferase [Armatimonadota bacterium]